MATRKPKLLHFWRGDLPHWQVEGGRYFVTIHLKDAIPQVAHQRIRELYEQHKLAVDPDTQHGDDDYLLWSRKLFLEMERWLDGNHSVIHFSHLDLCEMVVEAIQHRQRNKVWEMFSFAIMPSHIHLFFELDRELSLKRELEEFKRWTGHQATKINSDLSAKRFWQSEWFDHWSRSDEEDEKIIRYIQNNPIKAGLAKLFGEYKYCR